MFRDARDALNTIDHFKSQRVSLVLLDIGGDVTAQNGNGIAKMLFTILAAVAEWERDRTRERILDSKEWARDQGRFMGGIRPFGFQIVERDGVKMLEPDPVEQEAMAEMVMRREAGESIRAIQRWALDQGHKINHQTVHNIVEKRK
jgi:site-specific DNA recombinase